MIYHKQSFITVLMVLSTVFGQPIMEDVHYAIFENGLEIQITYSEPISEDDIIAWKTDRGRMVITLLNVGGSGDLETAPFFPEPLTSLFLDDFDGSTQLAFTFQKPILGFDIYQSSTVEKTTVFIHLADSQDHIESLKQEKGLYSPGQENRELDVSFPEYFEVELEEAMDWARKDLGLNALFKFHGSIISTNPNPIFYVSALSNESAKESLHPVVEKTPTKISKPKEKTAPAFHDIVEEEPLTITTDWIQIKEPDESFFPPEEFNELKKSQPPKTFNRETIQQEPTNWIDLESAFSASQELDELSYPSELKPVLSQRPEPTQAELDKEKWYGVQQRYITRVKAGIRVVTNLKGVPIYIDGKLVGESPLRGPIRVNPGWHQVSGFSPLYAQVMNAVGIDEVGLDPLAKNNQLFGSKTIYVEKGNVSVVNLKFNKISEQHLSRQQKDGGMAIGFPLIMVIFGLITWGLI